jgi:hypothetical protein
VFRRGSGTRGDTLSMSRTALASAVLGLAAALAGCGGSSHNAASPPATTRPTTTQANRTAGSASTKTTTTGGPSALQAEANAAAAGDIPDNQVFLLFRNGRVGYSMKYPEGWAQQSAGTTVVFRDKNNIVRVDVASGGVPTAAAIGKELAGLKGARVVSSPQPIQLIGGRGYKVVYSTESAPNAVTGKRVTLVVDRYYLARGSRRAVIDLGTPKGVDNVDAYRLMIESFRWR